MRQHLLAMAVSALALAAPVTATAGGMDALGDAVKDATGEHHTAWIMTKLNTFNAGAKCMQKLDGKDSGVIHAATFATREIARLAKQWTGDDWSQMESSGSGDRATNAKEVEPKVAAFKSRFTVTVNIEGDDCDVKRNALWLRWWSEAVSAATKYPTPAGKVFVTVNVTSKAREVTSTVSRDGTTFTFTGPKDIEPKSYADKIERPFRQLASGIADDFAFLSMESTGRYHAAWVLTKLHTWKVGKKCYPKLADKDSAVHAASYAVRDIASYAKAVGAEDWDAIETQSSGEPATNRGIVEKDIEAFRKRFSLTVVTEGDDCDATRSSMLLRAWTQVTTSLGRYTPKAKKVAITLTLSSKAKDVTVKSAKDGATFAITVPSKIEPPGWSDKIDKAFELTARKK